jgi:Domain of unknown function (DUF1918)
MLARAMLARAPGDVTRANAAQVSVPHRHDAHPIQPGTTGQHAQLRRQRTRAADQRTRTAYSAHVHANIVGHPGRAGEIVEVRGAGGEPPYLVRFDDGHTALVFPGPDAIIEHRRRKARKGPAKG